MEFGVGIFPTEDAQFPAELARMAEERGLRVPAVPRAHPHPRRPRDPVSGGRRAAARVQPHVRPVRRADGRRDRDRAAPDRDRDLPGDRARPDRHRQGGRVARPALGRAVPVRRRRRLERRGDAQPRHRPLEAVRDHARADRGDARRSGPRTRPATPVATSTSSGSGAGRSRSSSRTRRSSSAATGPR